MEVSLELEGRRCPSCRVLLSFSGGDGMGIVWEGRREEVVVDGDERVDELDDDDEEEEAVEEVDVEVER